MPFLSPWRERKPLVGAHSYGGALEDEESDLAPWELAVRPEGETRLS